MYKDSRIFVAGHAGLIGSAITTKLKEHRYEHIILKTHKELELTDKESVLDFFAKEKPEYVFLCAGKVGGILSNNTYPADYLHINLAIQNNVFEAAHKFSTKGLIFFGSSCTYPKDSPQPIKEEYLFNGPIEQTSIGYAAAKIAGLIGCKVYNQQYGSNRFIALIPNSTYGPNDNFDLQNCHVLSALLRRLHEAKVDHKHNVTLWGSGTVRREFIFNEDVADAAIFAMQNYSKLENQHYNVGTGKDFSIKELAEIISEIVGYEGIIGWDKTKPDGTKRKLLDSSKFLSLGWKPGTLLSDGIKKTYEWYLCKN